MDKDKKDLSIVIPVYNEEKNVKDLYEETKGVLSRLGFSYEIIFINDGSTDNTLEVLSKLKPVKIISFRKNFGQSCALDAGIKMSKGNIIITMDGDNQNDPNDIPSLIKEIEKGYDVVSGWRCKRKDCFSKIMASFFANFFRKILIKDGIHDSGCTLKAYKKECFNDLDLYGEIHRFIPGILRWQGFKIGEIKVNHRFRKNGKTKYTFTRIIKGFLDLISLWFWRKYSGRPLHFFGGIGALISFSGLFIIFLLFFLRIFGFIYLSGSILPMAGFFMILIGIHFFTSGLLMDVALKNYYKARKGGPYHIKELIEND